MAASRNRDIVERYFSQILNDGNLALVDELFAEDFQFHITTLPLPVKGREGEKGFVTGLRTGFPDIRFRIDHLIEEGDKIYARWSLTGTHDGNFLGIPPTGNRVVDQGGDIFHFVDGRCKEIWVNEDSLGLMRQMGVLPPPPGGEPPPQPTQRPSIPPATRKMTPAENKAIVRRYFDEIMNDANERSIEELISPNFLFTIPTHGPALGPAGEKAEVEMHHTAFPDVHFTIEDEFADAERVAIRWVARGTHLGPFLGIPATGKRFWIDGMGSYHIVDGKMVENQVNEDSLNLLIQVGAIQLPSGNGEGQMTPEENNRIARDFFESAWNRGDFSVLDKYLSPDTVDYSTLHGQPEHGSESFRQIISMFRSAFPDIHLNIEDEIYTGNKVVHRWMLNGTHQAPFMGVPATGKRVGFTGMTIVEMEGGKIRGRWSNPDIMGLMMQLGAIPPPPGG
jgi:steroid delta-isomerase-like uncharacterized protein